MKLMYANSKPAGSLACLSQKANRFNRAIVVSFLMLTLCAAGSGKISAQDESKREPVQLAWKFRSGEKLSLQFDQLSQSETVVLERTVKIKVRVKMHATWTVQEVKDGVASMTQAIHWVSMTTTNTNPDGETKTIEFDTRKEPAEDIPRSSKKIIAEMLKDVKPILGMPVHFKMDPRGKIDQFEIPEETKKALREASSSMELRKIFSAEGMNKILGPSAIELPEGPVQAQQTWDAVRKLQNPIGKFEQTFTYKLGEVSPAQLATIQVSSAAKQTGQGDEKTKIVKQTGQGTIKFDAENGLMTETSFTTEVETTKAIRPDIEINAKTRDEVMIEIVRQK